MIFCSKFIKTITSSALLAGVASSSFVSAYDTKLRRGISCNEDKDISSNGSKLEALTKKDVTNIDDENLFEDDELINNGGDKYRIGNDNSHKNSYENTKSIDKMQTSSRRKAEKLSINELKGNKLSSKNSLLNLKTFASIISA